MTRTHATRSTWSCAVVALLFAGCFRSADVDTIYCATDNNCPEGYICADSTKPGGCRLKGTVDAGSADVVGPGLDASSDGAADLPVDTSEDRSPSLDLVSPADTAPADTAPTDTVPTLADAAPDLFAPVDVAQPLVDALPSPVDAPVDAVVATDTRGRGPGDTCATPSDCTNSYCSNGTCVALLPKGGACQAAGQCATNLCVDGVCCESACDGQCQSCAEADRLGTCSTVTGTPRGNRPACGGAGTCAAQCGGTVPDSCVYPGQETACGSPGTCIDVVTAKGVAVCNGAGTCASPQIVPCSSASYCSGGVCVARVANGKACDTGTLCASGNCTNNLCCAAGQTACGSTCVNLATSNANCGACGVPCTGDTQCSGGYCRYLDGHDCDVGARCASGVCTPIWVDADGDGYGEGDAVTAICGTTPPAGRVTRGGDCCDSNSAVNPGQTGYFAAAAPCGASTTWDYNCSGAAEKQNIDAWACQAAPAPATCAEVKTGTKVPSAACGAYNGYSMGCALDSDGICRYHAGGQGAITNCH